MTRTPHILTVTLALLVAAIAAGCIASSGDADPVSANGTVTYVDLEGGFYGIVTDGGDRYLPLNLPDHLAADGLRVRFAGTIETDIVTIQQWGTPLQITAIEALVGTNDAVYLWHSGVRTYLDGYDTAALSETLQEITTEVDCTVGEERIENLRNGGTVVELQTAKPRTVPLSRTAPPAAIPNMTAALFVLHEPVGGDLSGTILTRSHGSPEYACWRANASWTGTLAGTAGINQSSDPESRAAAESYVTNLTEYRDYGGEDLALLWVERTPGTGTTTYTYRFFMHSMKDPAAIDRATVQVTVLNRSVTDSVLAVGRPPAGSPAAPPL
ncbi:hypothetical protein FGU65_06895 [Methanoculleus sp. FWC-SCC1]|uniref:Uncharacterized protein n=1 Tax=Methanoculleus frigidifontis TaxID=2584085 RepID=A0ABT8M9P4_9EURY|nr:hypothetical protein [Methanoculleus sp. FWC-SCC1]MDN7024616.1 hypothetical protein [Methanoculleus sp. FWC-SCC1]